MTVSTPTPRSGPDAQPPAGDRLREPRPLPAFAAPRPREPAPLPAARPRALPYPVAMLLVAGAYVVFGKLGLTLAAVHPSATAIWPGTGIALAALLVMGHRLWPGVFLGAFLVNATTAGTVLTGLGIATGNTLEAVVGAALVHRFAGGRDPFDRPNDIFRYTLMVALACTVSASLGLASLVLTGSAPAADAGPIWLTWWLGDMGGALVVAPFLLLWSREHRIRTDRRRALEAAALLTCLVAVGWIVFRWASPLSLGISLMFLCVPPLMWAAYRFDQRMGATALLVLAMIAVGGTLGRFGRSQPSELNQSLLLLQVFLCVKAVTTLVLAAVAVERRRAMAAVQATSDQLREAVAQLEAFSHAISHDLRTPIGTVVNCTSILAEDYGSRIGEQGMRALARIDAAAESATRLLDQLTEVLWSETGEGGPETVDMTALARMAYADAAAADDGARRVRFDLGELPPAAGSAPLLERILSNLLSNSLKFTRDREHRHIRVDGIAGPEENTYFVTDNGIGFDPADGDALFEPFRRSSGAMRFEGSGLGLAIAARIARKYGGRIWAESDGATWARFCFTLKRGGTRP